MDYYTYQKHHSQGQYKETPATPVYSISDGSNMYGSGNSDPRLNYTYYNATPSQISLNSQLPHQLYDLSLPKSTSNLEIKTDDELWIETWLSKIGKIQINLNSTVEIRATEDSKKVKPTTNAVQLHVARNSLKNCLHVLNKLQEMQEFLKSNAATMSSIDWKKKTMEIGTIKEEFSKLISQFENPDTVTKLHKAVEKRRNKRESQRRRRKRQSVDVAQVYENRRKAHKDIDQWLENMKEEVERAKMEEHMKKDADCVLAEVTKKKSDARKSLTLISSLVKLRQVRENTALQRGEKMSLEDSTAFAKISEHLTKIWNDALKVYSKEEQGLWVMLEQNAADDTNATRAAKERRITQEWEMVLFGPKCIPSPAFWGLTSAEKDLETFVAIRRSWDTFLTKPSNENGSKIPIGWVLPDPNTHERWTKYLTSI